MILTWVIPGYIHLSLSNFSCLRVSLAISGCPYGLVVPGLSRVYSRIISEYSLDYTKTIGDYP